MPSFIENINTILGAVYGKEMRPAIAEALIQSKGAVTSLNDLVNNLNSRVDALSGGGTTPDPGGGDSGGGTIIDPGELIPPILVVNGSVTSLEIAGTSTS